MSAFDFHALIRTVADFPKPGVAFRDVTPLLADAGGFARCIDALAEPWQGSQVQAVCGIESRGFIFGAALAQKLHAGFVPLRKPGKLPPPLVEVDYALEYGTDRLQARNDALRPGERTLIVDGQRQGVEVRPRALFDPVPDQRQPQRRGGRRLLPRQPLADEQRHGGR